MLNELNKSNEMLQFIMNGDKATLEGQFFEFAKMDEKSRRGESISLSNSDYWMRQAKILDDRKLTMTETGVAFNKFR